MAKRVNSFSCDGVLDLGTFEVFEVKKDSEIVVKLLDILQEFNGRKVAISIKETQELGNEEFESDEE